MPNTEINIIRFVTIASLSSRSCCAVLLSSSNNESTCPSRDLAWSIISLVSNVLAESKSFFCTYATHSCTDETYVNIPS